MFWLSRVKNGQILSYGQKLSYGQFQPTHSIQNVVSILILFFLFFISLLFSVCIGVYMYLRMGLCNVYVRVGARGDRSYVNIRCLPQYLIRCLIFKYISKISMHIQYILVLSIFFPFSSYADPFLYAFYHLQILFLSFL